MAKFIIPFFKWLFAFVVTRHSRKLADSEQIMLVSEKGNDARDNGYHFFRHVQRHHPEIKLYYVITPDSVDRRRFDDCPQQVIDYLSYRNCKLFWQAKYLVSTHLRAGHTPMPYALSRRLDKVFHFYRGKVVANIKHGITKDFLPRMTYPKTRYDLLVCGALPEQRYFVSAYGYPESVAQYLGFCRFDGLVDFQAKRQILVMPTYRSYLHGIDFTSSDFFKAYSALLGSEQLKKHLEHSNIRLVFYLHHKFQPYTHLFKRFEQAPLVTVADQAHYDVQQLLKESSLLVTDYSSVFFDFAYMRKPMVFYQFDYAEYRAKHFQEGYFDYHESFGPVVENLESLLQAMEGYIKNAFAVEERYRQRVNEYFPLHDTSNCKRVYDAIMECANKNSR